jgi:DNA invertase Pin-like site-specific DNA recombinase
MIIKERFVLCKVYGYCRVALESKEEIAEQMRAIAKCCGDNNLKVYGFFCDDGVSGLDIGPEFKHLLGEVKDGDTIVVKDLSRLSRSNAKLLMYMDQFENMGVKILCVDDDSEYHVPSMAKWLEERWAR